MALIEPVVFEIETVPEALLRSGSFTHVLGWDSKSPSLGALSARALPSVREDRAIQAERGRLERWLAAQDAGPDGPM